VPDARNEAIAKHSEPIFKIACSLMEKMLLKEKKRYMNINASFPSIATNLTFVQGYLIYAATIQLHLTNNNELSISELLDEVKLPAYELWLTLETFLNLDPTMPRKLREHFLDLER